MQHWYVLHAKPNKERQVQVLLAQRGIEVYFPTVPATRGHNGCAERAFFPAYLFVRADLDVVGLWPLQYAPGVRQLVMFGGKPARVDDGVIAALRERLAQIDAVDERGQALEPGDRVVITSGPLADLDAVFDRRLSETGRVRILIYLLQRWTKVDMSMAALCKTGDLPRRDLVSAAPA